MSNNEKFWLIVWGILVGGTVSLAGIIFAYEAYDTYQFNKQISAGTDPMALRCVKSSTVQIDPKCAIWFMHNNH